MGDAELLNELKRLQNVIIALNNQLIQDVIVNANLANVITELQNQVAQQVVTNTNVVNAVNRLTTITGQLVTVNTRALNETDIPFISLPYDMQREFKNTANVNNNTTINQNYTAADWGAGLDFYVFGFIFYMQTNVMMMRSYYEGFNIEITVQPAAEHYFERSYSAKDRHPFLYGTNYFIGDTFTWPSGVKVNTTETFRITFRNNTGVMITSFSTRIVGVALAPV